MKSFILKIAALLLISGALYSGSIKAQPFADGNERNEYKKGEVNDDPVIVKRCNDFTLTGSGNNPEWAKTDWNLMTKLDSGGKAYTSRFKILYSGKGIYLLFNGEDDKITTTADKDFGNIYEGDAFEVFFHPDPSIPKYFEYEINQLNKELILVITRVNNKGYSWAPWHFENKRENFKISDIEGGKAEPGNLIKSWTSEVFFPYELLDPLSKIPPASGDVWNANFCRLDYDPGKMIKWSWSPGIRRSFHELDKYRSIKFE